jgi:hypothetical protein
MMSGRTLSLLAFTAFIISMIVWGMSEKANVIMRGKLLDEISAEAVSNIKFLQTGRYEAGIKDITNDVLKEQAAGGRLQLDTRWLTMLAAPGVIKVKETRSIEIKKILTMIDTYNAGLDYQSNADANGDYFAGQQIPPPEKQQLIDGFNRLINMMKEARGHKNNLDF